MKPPPSSALVNRVILLTLALLMFTGSLGLGAVWMRQGISQAANDSRALVVQIEDIERRLDSVNAEIATAARPKALQDQNQAMRLGLATPRETQVVRVGESPELRLLRLAAIRGSREEFSIQPASLEGNQTKPVFQFVTASLR